MRVVMVCGGESSERDVSLAGGWALAGALAERGHEVSVIDPAAAEPVLADRVTDSNTSYPIPKEPPAMDEQPLWRERMYGALTGGDVLRRMRAADRVFMGLIGGWSEDGHVQALLEMAGISFTGAGSATCALSWQKDRCQALLGAYGVPVAERVVLRPGAGLPDRVKEFLDAGPVVVKPIADGSSVDVRQVRTREELAAITPRTDLLVEPFLPGREFTVGVVGDQVLPVVEIELSTAIFDYETKYQPGAAREICPAEVTPDFAARLQELARTAHDALGAPAYSRTDFRCDDDGNPYCLEVNALPGLAPVSLVPRAAAAHGWSYADLAEKILTTN